MTEQNDPDSGPLEYRSPKDDRADSPAAATLAWQAVAGAIVTALVLVGLVFGSFLLLYWLSASEPPRDTLAWTLLVVEGLVIFGALAWISARAYRNPRRRGWAFGIWIGVGLAILVEGICFGRLR
jgi:hypothetical protein